MAAGILDFALTSPGDFSPVALSRGESATRTIDIINYGNIHKYTITAVNFVGALCDYLNLEANLDGGDVEYAGALTGFTFGPTVFEEPESWVYTLTLPADAPENVEGTTCQFDSLVFGSQTRNNLPFGQGFSDTEDISGSIASKYCYDSEIKSRDYWKNHSDVYAPYLPQILGGYPADESVDTVAEANEILASASYETMREKLKEQLLAMKFNIAHFGIGEYLVESEGKTLNEIAAEADDLLRQDPPSPDSVLEEMKNLLDSLNNLGNVKLCSVDPPNECKLRLTKTTESDNVSPGDTIIYHLTFDNIGRKVCTGGGVKLKDTFGGQLQYSDYTSTRVPRSFNKSSAYLEWNFGSIYPDDPVIEIDLTMKVKDPAECDSTITNSANYWSDQTDWGETVTADTHVVCELLPGIVMNEFLPNPVGSDNALKPNGEWVELYNNSNVDINVAGWVIYDSDDSHELYITAGNTDTGDTVVTAHGFLVVYRNGDSDFTINNNNETIRLYNGYPVLSSVLIDSYSYTTEKPEGFSYARIPDGTGSWVDPIPTPGKTNVTLENLELAGYDLNNFIGEETTSSDVDAIESGGTSDDEYYSESENYLETDSSVFNESSSNNMNDDDNNIDAGIEQDSSAREYEANDGTDNDIQDTADGADNGGIEEIGKFGNLEIDEEPADNIFQEESDDGNAGGDISADADNISNYADTDGTDINSTSDEDNSGANNTDTAGDSGISKTASLKDEDIGGFISDSQNGDGNNDGGGSDRL